MSEVQDDAMVRRLMAEMDKQWGTVAEGEPRAPSRASSATPAMNEMAVCRLKALVRKNWPERFKARPQLTLIQGGKAEENGSTE